MSAAPPRGLGATLDLIRRIVGNDREAVDLLDRALQGQHGGDHTSEAASKFDNIQLAAPTGTSPEAALRRLRVQRPDLHARVLARELSPHAAMIEAAFRRKTMTVPVDSMSVLAAAPGTIHEHPDKALNFSDCLVVAYLKRPVEPGRRIDDTFSPA